MMISAGLPEEAPNPDHVRRPDDAAGARKARNAFFKEEARARPAQRMS